MASVTLNARYRPARIGFCVRNNDLPSALLATDFAHTLWGGRFCPIIPCDNAPYASRLIQAFRVDTLYAVTKNDVVDKVISAHAQLAWPILDRDLYFGENGEKSPQFLSVTHPIRILARRRTNIADYPTSYNSSGRKKTHWLRGFVHWWGGTRRATTRVASVTSSSHWDPSLLN